MSAASVHLARTESGRLLRNPALWLSLGGAALWAWSEHPALDAEPTYLLLAGYGLVLPGFVMLAITVLAVLRDRQSATGPLTETLPVGPARRTVGHALVSLAAAGVGLLFVAAVVIYHRPGDVLGPSTDTLPAAIDVPRPGLGLLLQGPVALIVLVALGVALARWLPSWLVVIALVIPFAVQFVVLGIWNATPTSAPGWWWPWSSGMVVGEWIGCTPTSALCDLEVGGFDTTTP